ncbi:MAG: ATP-binding domain-containing protein [bacterium]|nr:ATP-binding domain-containing protein [bacterium]MCP5044374.1 ATP-binding domain-containing protein [bacterium]
MNDPIVDEEHGLLEQVREALSKLPETRAAPQAPLVRELERLRELMISGDEAKDQSALLEQYHHQSAVLDQLQRAGPPVRVDPDSPYFGHLRLQEGDAVRDLCLGKSTCLAKGVRIVDWRDAPISKIFYRYAQGDDFDEEVAGRERIGEVLVRRMVRIREGELERVQAPEGDFLRDPERPEHWVRRGVDRPRLAGGEAAAPRAHDLGAAGDRRLGSDPTGRARRVDKHLPEITGLIDPTQFDLITRPSAGFLVIRGSAGSGKTTVALHRVAYLVFDDPRVDSEDTLVVMFSKALRNYVKHVLPSLGVGSVRIVTYPDWVSEERKRHFPRLPKKPRDDAPAIVQRIKLHPLLAVALEAQVERVHGHNRWEQALDDWASVLTLAPLLLATMERVAPGAFSEPDIEKFVEWNRARVDEVYSHLAGEEDSGAQLDPEDDAILLRAWQLRVGPLQMKGKRPLRYRHVVLDEVQDFSPLEVQVLLGCLGPSKNITLAGDTQQHVMQNSGFTSWSEFFRHLGVEGAEVETLKISYRSSAEIVHFAYSLLGALQEEDESPVATRQGPPVELFQFGHRGECVAFLADALRELRREEPHANVAVLTPKAASSRAYFEGLEQCEIQGLRLVSDEDFAFAPGVEVTEIEQVKGLEFDYVILVDVDAASYRDVPSARRILHVGATRAIHQLWLMAVGPPSPIVAGLLAGAAASD